MATPKAAPAAPAPEGEADPFAGNAPKVQTAAEANADNDTFHSRTPTASGKNRKLGDQVQPETMLDESNGNRTLMKPRTDPGPVAREGQAIMHIPSDEQRRSGQHRIRDVNEPTKTIMRTSTRPPHFSRSPDEIVSTVDMSPDLIGHGGASDMYNPEGRENSSLTQRAVERAAEAKELAPVTE